MATNYYMSQSFRQIPRGYTDNSSAFGNSGTSSTAADYMELRVMTNTGSAATGITKKDVIAFLRYLERRIIEDGMGSAVYGTGNVPFASS